MALARDPGRARTLGAAGQDGVARHYSVAREAERVLEVYARVAARGSLREAS
jgi:hypothetical protein